MSMQMSTALSPQFLQMNKKHTHKKMAKSAIKFL